MLRRLLQLVTVAIAVAAVLTPIVEACDRWDPFVLPANDTEMRSFLVVLAIGFTLAAVHFFARSFLAAFDSLTCTGMSASGYFLPVRAAGFVSSPLAAANSSPPPLRI